MTQTQLAAFGLHTLNNLPAAALACPYFKARLDTYTRYCANTIEPTQLLEVLDKMGATVGTYLDVRAQRRNNSEEIELYYCDYHAHTLVTYNGQTLALRSQKGKYYFFPLYRVLNRLDMQITFDQKKQATKHLKEPNYIGVFTAKKIADWFDYCAEYIAAIEEATEATKQQESDNLATINAHIASLGAIAKVTHHKDTAPYYIDTPHFSTVLELVDKGTYLSQRTTFRGKLADVARLERTLAAAEALVAHLRTYDNGKHLESKPGEDLINALTNR